MANIICGVDVSSQWLDARIGRDGHYQRFDNSPGGIEALAALCRKEKVELVAMEATGGYEQQPHRLLWENDIPAAIVNPRFVRRFAEGMGSLEKTDKIDAGIIAWFALVKEIKPSAPRNESQQRLKALDTRLKQLVKVRVAQKNERRLVTEPIALKTFDEMLALVTRQIKELEGEIASLIDDDPLRQKLDQTLRTIKGVAGRTVGRLLAELPELGALSGKAIAKLVGLAPLADDTGKSSGRRHIRGGRSSVCEILFVVGGVASRHDPDLKDFYQRLKAAGKPPKVVRIAVARKLLVRLNAKARDAISEFNLAT